jgi:hypothetical protein
MFDRINGVVLLLNFKLPFTSSAVLGDVVLTPTLLLVTSKNSVLASMFKLTLAASAVMELVLILEIGIFYSLR